MPGIGRTLSRFPTAPVRSVLALFAGAAILAGVSLPSARAQTEAAENGDESAMAIPRVAPRRAAGVALPQPLPPSEAARYSRIFSLQERGRLSDAEAEIERLDDRLLLGSILADRYLGRFHRSTPEELSRWLDRYGSQSDAPAIHALLRRRLPKGPEAPPEPAFQALVTGDLSAVPEDAEPPSKNLARNPVLDRTVAERASAGRTASALHLIGATKGMSPTYAAQLRAEVAQVLFTRNEDAEALNVAAAAFTQGPAAGQVAVAGYVAGLAAWRLGRAAEARDFFEAASRAPGASPAMRAAAAFWAARAHLRTRNPAGYVPWMKRAADEPRTFHGLLARRTLGVGLGAGFAWDKETLGEADVEAIASFLAGRRAFALLQAGQEDRAEAELRGLWPLAKADAGLSRSLMLVAGQAGFADLAAQIASLSQIADGRPRDATRFPVPKLKPRGGFTVDAALVYGLTRLESNFDAGAVSPAGARGLMQVMPVTAGYVASDPSVAESATRLHDPAINLDLGQRYLQQLARLDSIGNDLIRVLAGYNSGPGNFARWSAEIRDKADPLLFIEAIPVTETRAFVQHALAYTWIYATRLRLPAPSLDELAAGAFPRFRAIERTASPVRLIPQLH